MEFQGGVYEGIDAMKAVVQRVSQASLCVDDEVVSAIGVGLVVLAAVQTGDTTADETWMSKKLVHMRIFPDQTGKMNRSVLDAGGQIMLVSNFTVAGQTRKGRRPSFVDAMGPVEAQIAFDSLVEAVRAQGVSVVTGVFGAHMMLRLTNDGPVTLIVDSRA